MNTGKANPRNKKQGTAACPTCERTVIWSTANCYRPFCSERCKLIDLGEWVEERRSIPRGGNELDPTLYSENGG
ncbi:MAG: DNA gyrase inhibitor YacG [Gammaproteobacteria bacterium]|nr:DNA gyrase inhibitor YacG [Gammaproteobacteria bacterium]